MRELRHCSHFEQGCLAWIAWTVMVACVASVCSAARVVVAEPVDVVEG